MWTAWDQTVDKWVLVVDFEPQSSDPELRLMQVLMHEYAQRP